MNYYLYDGRVYSSDELVHYGVPGMKWGVRKERYKAMNRHERKKTREKYYRTEEGKEHKVKRSTIIGTVLGGPVVGIAAGLITAKRNGMLEKRVSQGKQYVEKLATTRTVELKSSYGNNTRVTGEEEAEFWKGLAKELEKQQS